MGFVSVTQCNVENKGMNALIHVVQNPHHKCDWETRMITDKKIIGL